MKYRGSCHCGAVAFEAEMEVAKAMVCNCSICQRKGALMAFVPASAFRLLTPEDAMSTYTFNRHVIRHRFCKVCGIHAFGEGTLPDGRHMMAINLRCVDGIEPDSLAVEHYNGRALPLEA
ncbi:GFA family protein [Uliginosibacterium paludis]|uniref:GFA family protein n=1 Tax=Uliginosibacterium paludis TaxID=1615952 RepID=A0ABV2CP87_9RHOO